MRTGHEALGGGPNGHNRSAPDLATPALSAEGRARERREVELRLRHRLESLSGFAAGVAHEMNTPLQSLGDSARFLESAVASLQDLIRLYRLHGLGTCECGSEAADSLRAAEVTTDFAYLEAQVPRAFARVRDNTARLAATVRAVLEFAHPSPRHRAHADLNHSIETVLMVARNDYRHVADVETRFGPLPAVECAVREIHQVLLALVVNAAHEIRRRNRGTGQRGRIAISTRAEGDHAVVTIADTGTGMPDHVRDRIFDPLLGAAEGGRGAELAICRSIVADRHDGALTCRSAPGEGTTFEVWLPLRRAARGPEPA